MDTQTNESDGNPVEIEVVYIKEEYPSFVETTESKRAKLTCDNSVYWCKFCQKGFAEVLSLQHHQEIHVKNKSSCGGKESSKLSESKEIALRRCKFCTHKFSKQQQLVMYLRNHFEEKPFKCHVCIPHKSHLMNHVAVHTTKSSETQECINTVSNVKIVQKTNDCEAVNGNYSGSKGSSELLEKLHKEYIICKSSEESKVENTEKVDDCDAGTPQVEKHLHWNEIQIEQKENDCENKMEKCETYGKIFPNTQQHVLDEQIKYDLFEEVEIQVKPYLPDQHFEYIFFEENKIRIEPEANESKNREMRCKLCGHTFVNTQQLEQHLFEEHPKCGSSEEREVEIVKEADDCESREDQCEICGQLFASTQQLKQHLHDKHNHEVFKSGKIEIAHETDNCKTSGKRCEFCDQMITNFQHLEGHLVDEHLTCKPSEGNESEIPQKSSNCRIIHEKHKNIMESSYENKGSMSEETVPLKCTFCTRTFSKQQYLTVHLRSHAEPKPIQCQMCGKGFLHESHLRNHVSIHANIKSSQKPSRIQVQEANSCKIIDERCSDEEELSELSKRTPLKRLKQHLHKNHLKRELQNKRGMCEICNQTFVNAQQLEEHLLKCKPFEEGKIEIPEKTGDHKMIYEKYINITNTNCSTLEKIAPWKCIFCMRTFSKRQHLNMHLKNHSKQKPFKCHLCRKCFLHKSHLVNHMAIHTNKRNSQTQKQRHTVNETETIMIDEKYSDGKESSKLPKEKEQDLHQEYLKCEPPDEVIQTTSNCENKEKRCEMCSQMFDNVQQLEQHLLDGHLKCDLSEDSKLQIEQNINYFENGEERCEPCGQMFASPQQLKQHLINEHVKCELSEESEDRLEQKPNDYENKEVHDICGQTYSNVQQLDHKCGSFEERDVEMAQESDSENSELICEICGQIFASTRQLKQHLLDGHVKCELPEESKDLLEQTPSDYENKETHEICGQTYSNVQQLEQHLLEEHKCGSFEESDVEMAQETNNCENSELMSDRMFGNAQQLEKHLHDEQLGEHFLVKYLKCKLSEESKIEIPQKTSDCNTISEEHKNAMEIKCKDTKQIAPRRCIFCTRTFSKQQHLNIHLRNHVERKPFKCHLCEKCFLHKSHLMNHMAIHTNTRNSQTQEQKYNIGEIETVQKANVGEKYSDCEEAEQPKGKLQQHSYEEHLKLESPEEVVEAPNDCKKRVVRCEMLQLEQHLLDGHLKCDLYEESKVQIKQKGNDCENKENRCEMCDQMCASPQYLKQHLLDGHLECQLSKRKARTERKANDYENREEICEICAQTFFNVQQLEHHLLEEHYKCRSSEEIELTQEENDSENRCNMCEICGEMFISIQPLEKHLLDEHRCILPKEGNIEVAQKTNQIFANAQELEGHSYEESKKEISQEVRVCKKINEKHKNVMEDNCKDAWKCMICTRTFSKQHHLNLHLRNHSKQKPFKCHLCGKCLLHKSYLVNHMAIHTNMMKPQKQGYIVSDPEIGQKENDREIIDEKCSGCEGSSKLLKRLPLEKLEQHLHEKHLKCEPLEEVLEKSVDYENRGEKCEMCSVQQLEQYSLDQHLKCDLSNESKVQIEQKTNYCADRQMLANVQHLEQHLQEKHINCELSEESKTKILWKANDCKIIHKDDDKDNDSLSKDITPWKCTFCIRTFSKQQHLNMHLRTHSNEKPFKCDVCENSFLHKSHLTNHMAIHTNKGSSETAQEDKNIVSKVETVEKANNCTIIHAKYRNVKEDGDKKYN